MGSEDFVVEEGATGSGDFTFEEEGVELLLPVGTTSSLTH